MYAVIEACGKQYKVQDGDVLFMEKLGAEVGETVRQAVRRRRCRRSRSSQERQGQEDPCLQVQRQEELQTSSGSQTALHEGPDQEDRSLTYGARHMTKIVFTTERGKFVAVRADGHSGYAEAGADIVCAAVSTAFGIIECAINDVAKANAPVACAKNGAALSLVLPRTLSENQRVICDSAMRAAYLWLSENMRQYGAYVQITLSERRPTE